jgi:hypothetical protein
LGIASSPRESKGGETDSTVSEVSGVRVRVYHISVISGLADSSTLEPSPVPPHPCVPFPGLFDSAEFTPNDPSRDELILAGVLSVVWL